jgi:hypothetical protein
MAVGEVQSGSAVGLSVGSPSAERLHVKTASANKANANNGNVRFRRLIALHYPLKHMFCQRTFTIRSIYFSVFALVLHRTALCAIALGIVMKKYESIPFLRGALSSPS